MATGKLVFDEEGKRFFETGVDHVVLYVYDKETKKYKDGVAWNGVTAISESPEGGEDNYQYADNIKYLNLKSPEEWNGSLTAFSSPKEFDGCDGTMEINDSGISFKQQTRSTFAIAFRTRLGNDTEGDQYGYKITVVYGLSATPSSRDHNTVNDSPEAAELSWDFSSLPIVLEDGAKTYNIYSIEVNSRTTTEKKMQEIIDKLYGTDAVEADPEKGIDAKDATAPTLMMPAEFMALAKRVDPAG